ncbi:5883_t:CDS:2, partial [Acaulospora morrowiae]
MRKYQLRDIVTCLSNRRVLFVGDSVVRTLFYTLVKKVNPDVNTTNNAHSNLHISASDINFEFIWDPYLNSSRVDLMFSRRPVGKRPSILLLGSGLWYLRYRDSGGVEVWKKNMNKILDSITTSIRSENITDTILVAPLEHLFYRRLSQARENTMHKHDIDNMNEYLYIKRRQQTDTIGGRGGKFYVPFVFNKILDGVPNATQDGLHFTEDLTNVHAEVLLNLRCNNILPKKAPMENTCCYRYPRSNWVQSLIIMFFLVVVPIGIYYRTYETRMVKLLEKIVPSRSILFSLMTFGLSVTYMFLSDRTILFSKSQKQFDSRKFTFLTLFYVLIGFFTTRTKEKEQPFLNRDQTDEWKGWMQLAILVYHYFGASSVHGIYNSIRVLVAAYLFMTGYGHFNFFYKKADFSLQRVATVVIRLNLQTIILTYLMDTNYLLYYFSPLTTFWFFVIYATMRLRSNKNRSTRFLFMKIILSIIVCSLFVLTPGVLEKTFDLFNYLFNITWSAHEWRFRLRLDLLIVFVGMLVGLINIKFQESRISEKSYFPILRHNIILLSLVILIGYIFGISRLGKLEYNIYHPYISFLAILSFIILRNATKYLRNTTSGLFVFFGHFSLETFITQFHVWMAADTKGLLVVTPPEMFWTNFAITSFIFIYVSYWLSRSAGELTSWIIGEKSNAHRVINDVPIGTSGTITSLMQPKIGNCKNDEANDSVVVICNNGESNELSNKTTNLNGYMIRCMKS